MEFKVGDKAFYYKVLGDKTSIELVDIVHIDTETKSVTIYIPSLKRERDTELARLMKQNPIQHNTDDLFESIGYVMYSGNKINVKNRFNMKEILLKKYNEFDTDKLESIVNLNDKCFMVIRFNNSPGWNKLYFIYKSYYIVESVLSTLHCGCCEPTYDITYHNITNYFTLLYIKSCGENDIEILLNESHILNQRNMLFDEMEKNLILIQKQLIKTEIDCNQLYDENCKLKEQLKSMEDKK